MREIDEVFLEGIWVGIGGNTPWTSSNITKILMDANIIYIHFDDGKTFEIKSDNYMVCYKQE